MVERPVAGDDGSISDVPWALVFDPAVNVRALGEIQARGFRAAASLVDRFVNISEPKEAVRPEAQEAVAEGDEEPSQKSSGSGIPDAERLLESWTGVVGQLLGSLRGAVSPDRPSAAAVDVDGAHASGQIELAAGAPGMAGTEVWLHNNGPIDRGTVEMRCGDLMSHDGHLVRSAQIRFDPQQVPMPARCSRGVVVEIDIGTDVVEGRYHGTVLVDGQPDVWLPMVLTVTHDR
jgi:hypothetical protein